MRLEKLNNTRKQNVLYMNWDGFILLDEKRNAFLFIPSFYSLITTR